MAVALTTLLAETEAAIRAVLNAQFYQIGTRILRRADLPELYRIREKLLHEIELSNGSQTGGMYVAEIQPAE